MDRALVVVEAVVGERHGAPDRASRVVDEHVDRARGRPAGSRRAASIAAKSLRSHGRDVGGAARGLDLGLDLVELLLRAGDEDRDAARGGDLQRGGAADAARRAGDHDRLAVDRALEGAVLVEVGVERALPVVPDLRRRTSVSGGSVMSVPRSSRWVSRASKRQESAMYSTTSSGIPRSARTLRADLLERRQLQREAEHALGQVLRRAAVDPHHGLGRVAGLRERVQDLADALALGVDDVEGLAVEAVLVGDVVDGRGDVVDRDDVRPAPLERDQREPLRQRVPDLLDQLEEVVRAVDLVHLAGPRVADRPATAGRRATAP